MTEATPNVPSFLARKKHTRASGSNSNSNGRTVATTCSATAAAVVGQEQGQRELYGQLCTKLKEVERLAGIQGLLSWDEQVSIRLFVCVLLL